MKPLNSDSQSCDPISSNCVIWQGPDIECIKLCKGDMVSDVVDKLAKELCKVMQVLNITSYDLSCFNLTACAPSDFQALIQFLIKRICQLEQCTGCIPDCNGNSVAPTNPGSAAAGCPDCEVAIASCFYFENQFGDTVTSMQLSDYVITLGNFLCQKAGVITTINNTLILQAEQIKALENKAPVVFTLPEFVPACVLPPVSTDIATILQALEQQFCALRNATGTPDEIYLAISKQCAALNTAPALSPGGGTMGSISGWINSPINLSDSITNMWLTICDLRSAVANIKNNCCPDGCEDIVLNLQLTLNATTLKLFITGNIPNGFQSCNPQGTLFTITDTSGGLLNVYVDVITNINNINGFPVNLSGSPLNLLDNLTVTASPCFFNNVTNTTCQSYLQEVYYNTLTCPLVVIIPALSSIAFTTPVGAGTADYTFEVWDAAGLTLISSTTQTITGPGTFAGTIGSLSSGTLYKVRLVITVNGNSTNCPFQSVTTFGDSCTPPESVVATIIE
jgi:hypothetical protein